MNLQHDVQGFLSGDRVGPQQSGAPASALIGAIHRDVAIIRRLLTTGIGRAGRGLQARRGAVDDAVESAVRGAIASPSVVRQAARSAVRQAVDAGARAAVSPRMRDSRGRFVGSASVAAGSAPITPQQSAGLGADSQRDSRGRFSGGGASDRADGSGVIGRLAAAVDGLGDAVNGADNIDPTISALKEVRDAVSPVGRGFMALHARLAERKKERWYSRILKAITGRRGEVAAGGAGGGDVQRGSFFGTMLGELGGKLLGGLGSVAGGAMGFIGSILSRVFAPVAAVWAAWEVGQWIGGKVYEWLDKSGLLTKAFDAFDSTVAWFKDKFKAAGETAKDVVKKIDRAAQDAQTGSNDARYHPMSSEDRREARQSVRGGAPESMAYKAGQAAGTVMRGVDTAGGVIRKLLGAEGKKRIYENADGSVVERKGGSVSWRNNNPGNLKFEFAGSADKTVRSKRSKAQALEAAQKRYEGVVDLDQFGNAIFASESHGRAAKAKLLQGTHGGLTIDQMLPKYAISDYSGTANHAAYAAGIYKSAEAKGLNLRGKKIGDMNPSEVSALLDGMKRVEGFKVGTVTPMTGPAIRPAPAMATLQAIKPQSVPPSVPERVQVVQPEKAPERVGWGREDRTVVVQKEEVGQDLRDRQAAHIVTGGIGG